VTPDATAAAFQAARPKLLAIAYRMLGTMSEAEDVVGDVAERWTSAAHDEVRIPEAWLVTATTRRALDILRSARLQRESYPGVWLPEPVATGGDVAVELVERTESLTIGFMLVLERLTPIERAVFVLHDAFEYTYAETAAAVGRSEAACRQAVRRARQHVSMPDRQTPAERADAAAAAQRFVVAGLTGDVDALIATLAPDVVLTSDGGGIVHAAIRPVVGPARVGRLITNLARRTGDEPFIFPCELNGSPALVVHSGGIWLALVIEAAGGLVTAVRAIVNPDKLERLVASIPGAERLPGPSETPDRFRHRRGKVVTARPP
jgi:RNA polymerase sigma-70 factor, ECF subfamily